MNIHEKYTATVWIGLAKVKPYGSNKSVKLIGGYVNVLGLATSRINFRKNVSRELRENGFKLLRLTDIERFNERIQKFKVDKSLQTIANSLISESQRIKFGNFHMY